MAKRYRHLGFYVAILMVVALLWLFFGLRSSTVFPHPLTAVLAVATCIFVWRFGLPHPRVGLLSLERLPQVGLLLVFSPAVAAAICGLASIVWPFLSRSYSQGSLQVATCARPTTAP